MSAADAAGAKPAAFAVTAAAKPLGMRKNGASEMREIVFLVTNDSNFRTRSGKQWHEPKKAFRPGSGLTSYEKRARDRQAHAVMKAKENEMKQEKEDERQVR